MTKASPVALQLNNISKSFTQGGSKLEILQDINLELEQGQVCALVGPSGSGKSTLLNIAGLLDKPDNGDVFVVGENCTSMSDRKRTLIRRHELGFVYQFHHLMADFTAVENVMMPMTIAGVEPVKTRRKAERLLEQFGLGARMDHFPSELSGGEQQRVAIARSLANNPSVVLADEPTGNLDVKTGERVFNMLLEASRSQGIAILMVTHNLQLAQKCSQQFHIEKAHVVSV